MSEFRVQKVRRALDVVLANGHRMTGYIFLEPIARHHPGEQDPRELMNDDEDFFPIDVNGQLTLLSKQQVRTATYRVPADPNKPPIRTVEVKVILADGTVLNGEIELESRTDAERLLDYLNSLGGRFLSLMVEGAATCLVNRRMIAGVQQR
jgi:hypothetical protein